jgi:hypothetical protein
MDEQLRECLNAVVSWLKVRGYEARIGELYDGAGKTTPFVTVVGKYPHPDPLPQGEGIRQEVSGG